MEMCINMYKLILGILLISSASAVNTGNVTNSLQNGLVEFVAALTLLSGIALVITYLQK